MRKTTLTIFLVILTTISFGQATQTRYYNNQWLEKETEPGKGKFSQTKTNNADGTITTEIKNIKKNEVISRETYKGDEPYGIWIYKSERGTKELDYNFPLVYSEEKCTNLIKTVEIHDYFCDDETLGYQAPKISTGEPGMMYYLPTHLNFPNRAKEEGIQGKVQVVFTIEKDGTTNNFYVQKGAHILLDKEAVRTLKEIRFSNPPTLQGQPQSFCVTVPISFVLR